MHTVRLIAISRPVVEECVNTADLLAYCARVSNPDNQANSQTATKLLVYLVKNKHWSPLEMASMTVEISTSRTVARQILRHRSFSFQEFSQRYAKVTTNNNYYSEARTQDLRNRQASNPSEDTDLNLWWGEEQKRVSEVANAAYTEALKRGIAKEVARNLLPEGITESVMYMAGTVRSFVHYCQLRCGNGTQKEHQHVANKVREILLAEFPALAGVL